MSVNVKSGGQRIVLANKSDNYELPIASTSILGGIKIGQNLSINAAGVVSATDTIYELPVADTTTLGGVKPDGTTTTTDVDGTLHAAQYTLPAATTTSLGGVIIDNSTITVDNDGTIHAVAYVLPTASTSTLGGIKVGDNLSIDATGILSATDPVSIIIDTQAGNDSTYSSNKILQLINAIHSFEVEIVTELPAVGDPHKIYFVPKSETETGNVYDEYMYLNNNWEKIGSTEIHISIATTSVAGIVKPDGITITVAADGTIAAVQYELPIAAADTLGGIKVGDNLSIEADGTLNATDTIYTLPAATSTIIGGVKPDGTTTTVDADGTIHSTAYELPIASTSTLGGIKVGDNLSIETDGTLNATDTTYEEATTTTSGLMSSTDKAKLDTVEENANNYSLPNASESVLGGIKVGDNLSIDANGILAATDTIYELPAATTSTLGGVKPDGTTTTTDVDGTLHAAQYTLPAATTSTLGGVKADGTTITVDADGTIHGASTYELPVATTSTLGGIKVGTNLSVTTDGVLSATDTTDYDELSNKPQINSVELDGNTSLSDLNIQAAIPTYTSAQYEQIKDTIPEGTIFNISDDLILATTGPFNANEINYSGTESGLSANNVQDAIDEVNAKLAINEFTIATTAWTASTASADYPYEANISAAIYNENFIPIFVDIIPADGSPFFSEDEQSAKEMLNQNVAFTATGFTVYANDTVPCAIKLRICG